MTGETVTIDGVDVENVLVEPGEAKDADLVTKPAGAIIAYTLRLPVDFEGPVSDVDVVVRGIACRSVRHSDHYRAREVFGSSWALPWDMTMLVERVEADMRDEISVVETSSRYVLGELLTDEKVLYEGLAQARMLSGDESLGPDGSSDATETWVFVIPRAPDIACARPGSLIVRMRDVDYDVVSVNDLAAEGDHVALEAKRHG